MYLKQAIELANKALEDKEVTKDQVRNWKHLEVLPNATRIEHVKPKGSKGVYPEDMPSRIATIAELKDYYKTKEIAQVVDWLEPLIDKHDSVEELESSEELKEVASKKLETSKENLFGSFIKDRDKRRQLEIFYDYLQIKALYDERIELLQRIDNLEKEKV